MQKLDVRLGSLGEKLVKAIKKTGQTPSEFVRQAIAEKLGVAAPELQVGNPNFKKQKPRKDKC